MGDRPIPLKRKPGDALDNVLLRRDYAVVDTAARNQIRLILNDLTSKSEKAFSERVANIYSRHAAKGYLKSGATVKVALIAAEQISDSMISSTVNQVAPVAKDVEAFAMICEAVDRHFAKLAASMDAVAKVASGQPATVSINNSVRTASKREFASLQATLTRRLEIHRFTFTQPSRAAISLPDTSATSKPRKGGRPPSEFWDDMWAAIAASLYNGELQPKSQADVERAMTDWIEGGGFSAAVSTIRARARRLWDRIAQSDE